MALWFITVCLFKKCHSFSAFFRMWTVLGLIWPPRLLPPSGNSYSGFSYLAKLQNFTYTIIILYDSYIILIKYHWNICFTLGTRFFRMSSFRRTLTTSSTCSTRRLSAKTLSRRSNLHLIWDGLTFSQAISHFAQWDASRPIQRIHCHAQVLLKNEDIVLIQLHMFQSGIRRIQKVWKFRWTCWRTSRDRFSSVLFKWANFWKFERYFVKYLIK